MQVLNRSPAAAVIDALQRIEDAIAVIETRQGEWKELNIVTASLEMIWGAVERNAGVRAAVIDTFETARALATVETSPDRVRLRRLLRQALAKLRDRVEAPALTADARCTPGEWAGADAA